MLANPILESRLEQVGRGFVTDFLYHASNISESNDSWLAGYLTSKFNYNAFKFYDESYDVALNNPLEAPVYYNRLKKRLRAYLVDQGFDVAVACFDILMEKKDKPGYVRKDGFTPDWVHELRQLEMAISFFKAGKVPRNHPILGSVEKLFCATLIHDLGEDFNILMPELRDLIRQNLVDRGKKTEGRENFITDVSNIMVILTHYRKYTEEDLAKKWDFTLTEDVRQKLLSRKEEKIRLEDFEKHIKESVDYPYEGSNLKCWASLRKNKENGEKEIVITHTRYAASDVLKPENNSYINTLKQEPYALLAKFFDRTDNIVTRLGIVPFDIYSFIEHLDTTEQMFSIGANIQYESAGIRALKEAILAADNMLGLPYYAGRLIANQYPLINAHKDKVNDPKKVEWLKQSLDFKKALSAYRFVDKPIHPISSFSREFRDFIDRPQENSDQTLREEGFEHMVGIMRRSVRNASGIWIVGPLMDQA